MSGWLILLDEPDGALGLAAPHRVVSPRQFVAEPSAPVREAPKVVNLARSLAYQSEGYYASLLAEARGQRIIPSVETILDLSAREGYARALPELEHALNREAQRAGQPLPQRFLVCFGQAQPPGLAGFARLLFDWFRAPAIRVTLGRPATGWLPVSRLALRPVHLMTGEERRFFSTALAAHTRRAWRVQKQRRALRYSIAVLQDPKEALPPSSTDTLRHFARQAARRGVEVEPITRRDLARLAEFDGLFIRETTSIRDHTFRFARRAWAEGMPVIDDPTSMIRCTNKVYLFELLRRAGLPTPRTLLVRPGTEPAAIADRLGLPAVLKIPDGSFSRGVRKAATLPELERLMADFLADSDLILAQEFLPTAYDWRVGVLENRALFACQYLMARGHWQIVKHREGRPALEGGFRSVPLAAAPAEVVDLAVRAAGLIGAGFYGVDIKETPSGPVVIEINDNPNLEHGVEDRSEKAAVWDALTGWFLDRFRA